MPLTSPQIQAEAYACGFEIAGVTSAAPHADFARFETWAQSGKAAGLRYLTDHRGDMRANPQTLLAGAQSIICLGKMYNTDQPFSTEYTNPDQGPDQAWISRYAWGQDYHDVLRRPLENLARRLAELNGAPFHSKICIDTAPLLERSYARAAGLGWIGKNTCLISQQHGSWFFLAELLVDIFIAPDSPVPDRCGTCTRCIQACPTDAIVPNPVTGFDIDARLCISYLTIEERGPIPAERAAAQSRHIFGCDICQDVCPWNLLARANQSGMTTDTSFKAKIFAPDLAQLAALEEADFRTMFRHSPVWRCRYEGFLRNVAIAMGNSGRPALSDPLKRLTKHHSEVVRSTALAALTRLTGAKSEK